MWKLVALTLFLALSPLSAVAQTVADWAEIESIEVRERPGPALWHLTRGNSEVWLLGMAGAMPDDLDWNKEYVSELLDGARAILMPPKADIALTDIAWFLIWHGGELSLPRGRTLEESLPADLRARFVAVRDKVSDDSDDYHTDIPIRAAMRLQQDVRDKADLSFREPRRTIENHFALVVEAFGHAATAWWWIGMTERCRWHATDRPADSSTSGGSSWRHTSIACGQRGWKRQPLGGRITLGTSPRTTWR